jgi:hypothetical protein
MIPRFPNVGEDSNGLRKNSRIGPAKIPLTAPGPNRHAASFTSPVMPSGWLRPAAPAESDSPSPLRDGEGN